MQLLRKLIQISAIILTSLGLLLHLKITLIIFLIIAFFLGPAYCGWICPLGFLQELVSTLGNILRIRAININKKLVLVLSFIRYLLYLTTLIVSTQSIEKILKYDSKSVVDKLIFGKFPTLLVFLSLLAFLLSSMYFKKPFCNYFCIVGAKYSLLSQFRLFSIKRNKNTCVDCKACDHICPMNIQVSTLIESQSIKCIDCLSCISICPVEHTITYGLVSLKRNKKRFLIGLICLLVFLLIYKFDFYSISVRILNVQIYGGIYG